MAEALPQGSPEREDIFVGDEGSHCLVHKQSLPGLVKRGPAAEDLEAENRVGLGPEKDDVHASCAAEVLEFPDHRQTARWTRELAER